MSTTPQQAVVGTAVAVWIVATIATLLFLREASGFLIPIVLAVLISYALEPVVAWLHRHRVPRLAGATVVLLALFGALIWGGYSLRDEARRAVDGLPAMIQKARHIVDTMAQAGGVEDVPPAGSTSPSTEETKETTSTGQKPGAAVSVSPLLQQGLSSVFTIMGDVVIVILLVFFLLLSGHHVRRRIVEIAGPDPARRRTAAKILEDIDTQVQRFLLVRLFTSAIVGIATWALLAWMNVESAAVWGTLAGVFNSIPYFGPVIVSGGLLLVGLAQDGGLAKALQMSGGALLITSLEGWLLTPPLLGKAERMSALAVFVGLLLWTWIWGPWGTILAVPMLVVLKSVADRVEALKPIGRLLAP
jgi:predicted PurR-regulated permease PerM